MPFPLEFFPFAMDKAVGVTIKVAVALYENAEFIQQMQSEFPASRITAHLAAVHQLTRVRRHPDVVSIFAQSIC